MICCQIKKRKTTNKNDCYDRSTKGRKNALKVCECDSSHMRRIFWYALLPLCYEILYGDGANKDGHMQLKRDVLRLKIVYLFVVVKFTNMEFH
jgi:hypothetical protein